MRRKWTNVRCSETERGGEFRITELASNTVAERHLLYELVACSARAFIKQQHAAIRSHGKSIGSWLELTNHLCTANHSLSFHEFMLILSFYSEHPSM